MRHSCHAGRTGALRHLPKIPRITQDYGDFVEYDLSMECPEAARMLLTLPPEKLQLRWEEHPELAGDMPEYDADRMQQLFEQREMLFQMMRDTRHPALAQLSSCLKLACEWENIPFPNVPQLIPVRQFCISAILRNSHSGLAKDSGTVSGSAR